LSQFLVGLRLQDVVGLVEEYAVHCFGQLEIRKRVPVREDFSSAALQKLLARILAKRF